ncbi:smad nuclear-interacting protein 1 [Microplitis demolitor]|uniref:smad nuclear-interacting protein 1 n=1 Tax=Microplitis demolitor TaxID=69319 RepID=UPI000440026D|nr:smad nuclear-interacting protein 1 [Microplitis demolitor]
MSGHASHRDRSRRKDSRSDDYDVNRRERNNKDRYNNKNNRYDDNTSRNNNYDRSPPARRPRDRSRSRHRDDNRKTSRFDNRRNDRPRGDRNYDKFSYNDDGDAGDGHARVKREPSPNWGRSQGSGDEDKPKPVDKEKPNFELSGKLTEDANTVNGIVIKYAEPDDARKPKRGWRLYPFKGEKSLPLLYVHRQSAYLLGRDRKVADIPLDHPSCSKQHAALQYRLVSYTREDGTTGKRIRPYLIDLESANGTFVNDVKLEPRRFHELLEKDVIKFGFSSREYVLLHERSKNDELDDDVAVPSDA